MIDLTKLSRLPTAIPLLAAIVFVTGHSSAAADDTRDWKTRDGKYEVTAELVDASDALAKLRRPDGEVITVPLKRLRNEDLKYIRRWKAAKSAKPIPGIVPHELGKPVDLLPLIDLTKHAIRGTWHRDDQQALIAPEGQRSICQVPYDLPQQYQLRMVAQRAGKPLACSVAFPIGGHEGLIVLDSGYGKKSGLVWIDTRNEPNNETYYRNPVFSGDQEAEIICTVNRQHVHVTCDGKTIMQWVGDPARLTLDQRWWSGIRADKLLIGASGSEYRFSLLELRPILKSQFDHYKLQGKPADASESVALIEHPTATGTGFLAAPNLLVTNAHVIDGAMTGDLKIFFPRQSDPLPVHAVLSVDRQRDLAILSVQSPRPPLPVAHDGHYARGETVNILGNPSVGGGAILRNARVTGTLMATLRVRDVDLIQIDANINSGSSGGPILNQLGQVVGVTVMKATDKGEDVIRNSLQRLDDSYKIRSASADEQGVALAIPGRDLASALDRVRRMSTADGVQSTDAYDAGELYRRLRTLAGIRMLQALVNVPDQMRRAEAVVKARGSGKFIDLIPASDARVLKAALQSPPVAAIISQCEQNIQDHLTRISNSEFLPSATGRDLRALTQKVKEIEALAARPGTDYRRFSATAVRIQESLKALHQRMSD